MAEEISKKSNLTDGRSVYHGRNIQPFVRGVIFESGGMVVEYENLSYLLKYVCDMAYGR